MTPRHDHVAAEQVDAVPHALRTELVDGLVASGAVPSVEVEAALRTVPRHLFLPGIPVEAAYAEDAVATKRDEHGIVISSVSAPQIVAIMLEQLRVQPGDRVLEIGSGGYNAALLTELAGSGGEVTSMDIDRDVIERAQAGLAAAGYQQVNLMCDDAEFGAGAYASFDRIIVTVGAWDIPPAWTEQLAAGGRLVVPLRMRGLTRSVAFEHDPSGCLAGQEYELCGFVPMQGLGQFRERVVRLHGDDVTLRVDDGQRVDGEALRRALTQPRAEVWSAVTAGVGQRVDDLQLWLALGMPTFCVLAARHEAVSRGVVAHASPLGVPTAVDGDSFAYLAFRPATAERKLFEFGAYGHGPGAVALAERMVDRIQSWDSGLRARIQAYPAGTPDDLLPAGAFILDKRHTRIAISWR
ncbi:MAG TPA: methyltransferase, FxLD system [Micromonosporaceae bacterium]|nr:methyltransferase, FxLD system [Micromonosporaceae bacterium]